MGRALTASLLVLTLAGCGADKATTAKLADLESRNQDFEQRLAKLEKRLDEAEKQAVIQQQTIQAMNERLKTAEVNVDKLALVAH